MFTKILLTITLLLSIAHAQALSKLRFKDAVVDQITSIYDGDTFRANIKDYPPIVGHRMSIRINGIDTPEMKAKCAKEKKLAREAKQLTVSKLRNAKKIELKNIKRGKYFRLVADVYVDGVNLADLLKKKGLAVNYDGGKKSRPWCR